MKRLLLLATLSFASVAMGQSPHDVPENHWASKAVADLYRIGVLKGYPDGLYRGSRPVTRFEMAQAINAAFQQEHNATSGMLGQVREARNSHSWPPRADVEGLAQLRKRLETLENLVNFHGGPSRMGDHMPEMTARLEDLLKQVQTMREDVRLMRGKVKETIPSPKSR